MTLTRHAQLLIAYSEVSPGDRQHAGQELLDAEPISVAGWPDLKQDLLDAHLPPPAKDK